MQSPFPKSTIPRSPTTRRPMLRRTVCRLSTVALSCSAAASVLRAECNATPESPPALDFSLLSTPAAGAQYKEQFTDAYNTASKRHATGRNQSSPDDAQLRVRRSIAKYLMGKLGYTGEELAFVSEEVTRTQGVKSPFPAAALQLGEAVVDLGSGFGIDVFLAASKVGAHGSATGVDLSAEEVRCASVRAEQRGASNARFVVGDMEALPMPPATVDCVISNGASLWLCAGLNLLLLVQEVSVYAPTNVSRSDRFIKSYELVVGWPLLAR